jgi:hypothetical protein
MKLKMKVAFLSNKLTLRGTEVAMYDYADYNETLLGNTSIIITRPLQYVSRELFVSGDAYQHFQNRFPMFYYLSNHDIDHIIQSQNIDVLYIIKSGVQDGLITNKCKTCIHAVFESNDPHGDVYAVVGPTVNEINKTNHPVVPHMIRLGDVETDMRAELGISKDTIVFGRYGGPESFDVPFVLQYLHGCRLPNIIFLFMNTYKFTDNPRCIFIDGTSSIDRKRQFINTCDALLHARQRGETFGLTCGEFMLARKHVITYGFCIEKTHLSIMQDRAIVYNSIDELDYIIKHFNVMRQEIDLENDNPYEEYSPESVMNTFQKVFLS